jgi:tripartite-type tricarboxylate transporter receptor subunit TctC
MIAQAVGVEPTKVNYIAYAGGGEAQAAIMGGHVAAGISGFGEFCRPDQVRQAARTRDLVRQARPRHRHSHAQGTGCGRRM